MLLLSLPLFIRQIHLLPTVLPTTAPTSIVLLLPPLLLAPGWRCPWQLQHSVIRGQVHLVPTAAATQLHFIPLTAAACTTITTTTSITTPLLLLPRELPDLVLPVLLQEVAQVGVAGATCCNDELLCGPASLLEAPQGQHRRR